jgi:hypothetical protein
MNKAETALLEIFRAETQEVKENERECALNAVSGVLCWLTIEPPMSCEKLIESCLAEFERANKYKSKQIDQTINYYRKVSKQLDGQK